MKQKNLIPELGCVSHPRPSPSEPQFCHLENGLMNRPFAQWPAFVKPANSPPKGRAPPGGYNKAFSPLQDQFDPKGGAASHITKGPRKKEEKKTIFRFIEGGKGKGSGGDGGVRWGTIKCFCFIYQSEISGGSFSRRRGASLLQLQAAAKPSQGEQRKTGGAKGPPNTPSDRSHKRSPPTLNASTPGNPSGKKGGVCTQERVALGWVGEGITYPQQRWVARGWGIAD